MLMRFDPFRELDRLTPRTWNSERPALMAMDAYRDGDTFRIHLDVPGVDPASIDLTIEKNVLTVQADRSWRPTEGSELVVTERPQGSFSRQLFLGEGLDPDGIEASCDKGVLTVTVPVAEQAKPRKVEIAGQEAEPKPIDANSHAA